MLSTYLSYQLVTRDIGKSLDRVEDQVAVKRETEYYLANIGKVKTAEEFVNNYRLFNYAMKAHGLEDMAYAKAFMLKALKEGIQDSDSFANKLTDKRYADFVRSFNFEALGEEATTYVLANHGVAESYLTRATPPDGTPAEAYVKETEYYSDNIGHIKTIEQFLHKDNERLLLYALQAFGLEGSFNDKALLEKMLEGGTSDADSPANKHEDENWARFVKYFDFAGLGEQATSYNRALQPSVDKFLRQKLEEDSGEQSEGVRLALYFQRKAGTLTNAYEILADKALATVVRTYLGLPDAIAQMDVDRQAKLIEDRLNLEDFKDPAKIEKFITRFSAMWDVQNTDATQAPILALFQPVEYGISADSLMAIATLKR